MTSLVRKMAFRFERRWNEKALRARSVPAGELLDELAGKSVAIVGNARSLQERSEGARIDGADLVIRINRAPMPSAASHGSRTNWLALATSLDKAEADRIAPERILWMSHKRKRLPYWVATRPGFFLYPLEAFEALKTTLGAPPTTGAMMIDMVLKSDASEINLFGFDFFSSLSLTGSRTAAQVPHDFAAEKAWVETRAAGDVRLTIN